MLTFKRLLPILAAASLMLAALAARAATDPLTLVPKDAEAVIGINPRLIIDSDLFKLIQQQNPRIGALAEVFKSMSGVNLLTDIDHVYLYGRPGDQLSVGAIFQARVDKEKLLTLLKSRPNFEETKNGDLTVYQWLDEGQKQIHFGAFLPDNLAVIWNSKEAMAASLDAMNNSANSFAASPDAKLIPADAQKAFAWIVAINRHNDGPLEKYHATTLMASLTLTADQLGFFVTVLPQNPADTQKWVDMARGMLALAQLQTDNAFLQGLAGRTKIDAAPDGKSATVATSIDQGKLMETINESKNYINTPNRHISINPQGGASK